MTSNTSNKAELSEFTKSQFDSPSLAKLADSWINLLEVQNIGLPDTLILTVEFVTPITDGRTRWMKTVIAVNRDDYMFHEERVIDLLITTVQKQREQIKAAQQVTRG